MARLSRNLELIDISDQQLTAVADFFRNQEDILAVYLHGSYGTEYQTPLSDVDFAFLPMPNVDVDYYRELQLGAALTALTSVEDVNTVNLHSAPITIKLRVIDQGHLLYVRDDELLANFIEFVIKRYSDYEPDLRRIYSDYDKALRREFL